MDVPDIVYWIWGLTLVIAVVVILPIAVYLLHRTWKAARSIELYFGEMRDAGVGIAGNTGNIKALDDTIAVATQIIETSGQIMTIPVPSKRRSSGVWPGMATPNAEAEWDPS